MTKTVGLDKPRDRTILILRSEHTHDDLNFVIQRLESVGVATEVFNVGSLFNNNLSFSDFVNRFDWGKIGVIDIRYCRGLPRRWEEGYKSIFSNLNQFLTSQQEQGNTIRVTPSIQTIEWVLDKAGYMEELQGIAAVPTVIIPPLFHNKEQQPIDFDITAYFSRKNVDRIVLKPTIGSGADNLEFIAKVDKDSHKYEVELYQRDSSDAGCKDIIPLADDQTLRAHFQDYRTRLNRPVMLQDYVETVCEVSAVYINGIPHFVERSLGENTKIAHEKFGGENTFVLHPPQSWKTFAQEVYQALPDSAKKTVSIRIDIFNCTDGRLLLSEIEGASHRVFFPEFLTHFKENPEAEKQEIKHLKFQINNPAENYIRTLCNWLQNNDD